MSIEVKQAPDAGQELHQAFHDMRPPVASVLALAAAVLTEPGLPAAARRLEQTESLTDIIHACFTAYGRDAVLTVTENGPGCGGISSGAGLRLFAVAKTAAEPM